FTVTRSDTTGNLTVYYSVSGTASAGDYSETLTGSVVIPDGLASAVIDVTPVDDAEIENDETVVLTLTGDPAYSIGAPSSDTVTIASDDVLEVTIAATDPNASETGPNAGTLTITRAGTGPAVTDGDLTVNYNVSGTASAADYTESLTGSVVIPDGQGSVDVTITPVDDPDVEGDETVTLTVTAGSGYTVGAADTDTVTIADNDVVGVVAQDDFESGDGSDQGRGRGRFR
ncbi:MAG: Calx-beta domain-containing protein, partial [Planctomycetota bacterium]